MAKAYKCDLCGELFESKEYPDHKEIKTIPMKDDRYMSFTFIVFAVPHSNRNIGSKDLINCTKAELCDECFNKALGKESQSDIIRRFKATNGAEGF